MLCEAGDKDVPFFLIQSGQVEIVRPTGSGSTLIALHGPGQFTGEINLLSGRPTIVRARATQPCEVVEMDRRSLLTLVQTDSDFAVGDVRSGNVKRVASAVGEGSIAVSFVHRALSE